MLFSIHESKIKSKPAYDNTSCINICRENSRYAEMVKRIAPNAMYDIIATTEWIFTGQDACDTKKIRRRMENGTII